MDIKFVVELLVGALVPVCAPALQITNCDLVVCGVTSSRRVEDLVCSLYCVCPQIKNVGSKPEG